MPQTDGWKPGPPPLDTPGTYHLIVPNPYMENDRLRYELVIDGNGFLFMPHFDHRKDTKDVVLSALWHFHIPDPPETET